MAGICLEDIGLKKEIIPLLQDDKLIRPISIRKVFCIACKKKSKFLRDEESEYLCKKCYEHYMNLWYAYRRTCRKEGHEAMNFHEYVKWQVSIIESSQHVS